MNKDDETRTAEFKADVLSNRDKIKEAFAHEVDLIFDAIENTDLNEAANHAMCLERKTEQMGGIIVRCFTEAETEKALIDYIRPVIEEALSAHEKHVAAPHN